MNARMSDDLILYCVVNKREERSDGCNGKCINICVMMDQFINILISVPPKTSFNVDYVPLVDRFVK